MNFKADLFFSIFLFEDSFNCLRPFTFLFPHCNAMHCEVKNQNWRRPIKTYQENNRNLMEKELGQSELAVKRKRPKTIQNDHSLGKWHFRMFFGRFLLPGNSVWPNSFSIGFLLFSQFWILDAQCKSHRALVLKWDSQFGEIPGGSNCGFVRLLACSLDNIRRWW